MSSDADIYKHQNFGNSLGMGAKIAMLIVDFVNGFDDPDQFGGGNVTEACDNTVPRWQTQVVVMPVPTYCSQNGLLASSQMWAALMARWASEPIR